MANSPIIFGANGATSLVPGGVTLPGSTSGSLQIQPAAATTTYAVTMPATQGASSTFLQNNGSGVLSWSGIGGAPVVANVANVTAWAPYTMVVTATTTAPSIGTTTINQAEWRQVGDSIQIRWDLRTTGTGQTAGSGTYLYSLPNGYSIDSSKIALTGPTGALNGGTAGVYSYSDSGGAAFSGYTVAYDSTHFAAVAMLSVTAGNYQANFVSSGLNQYGAGIVQMVSMCITLPIVGLNANNSYTLGNGLVSPVPPTARYSSTVSMNVSNSFGNVVYNSVDFDTSSMYNNSTGVITIPSTGKYQLNAAIFFDSASALPSNTAVIMMATNQVSGKVYYGRVDASSTANAAVQPRIVDIIACNAGDTIVIQAANTVGNYSTSTQAGANYFSIVKVSS